MKKWATVTALVTLLCTNSASAELLTGHDADEIRNNMIISANSFNSSDVFSEISSIADNKKTFTVSNGEVDVTVTVFTDEENKTAVVNMSSPISNKSLRYIPKVVRYASESIELTPDEKESILDPNTIYFAGEPSVGLASGTKSKRLKKSIFLVTDYDMKENISMSFYVSIEDYRNFKGISKEVKE